MLTQLATQLETCDRIAISTLTGMGGIGKSELALQYAQQEYKKNTYLGGIAWLNVADSDVGTSILSFAQFHLGLTLPTKGTLEERVRFCWQNWFKNEKDESLIIFDDVRREYKQIKAYLPPQTEKRFKVIITTRNNNLSATIQTLQLPILGQDAALDLLRSYVEDGRIDQDLDAAKSLCRDLGYLPLALELVARLLRRRNNWSVEDIWRRLSEKRLSLQRYENFDQEMTAERGVEAAFDLTWENLDENSRLLAIYLSLFALAPVSKSLIDDLLGEQDPDDIEEWLADNLVNLNLVNDLGNNWYELHTLIRVYLREKLEESAFKEEAKRAYCKVMVDIAKDVNQTLTLADVSRLKPYIDHLKIAVDELNEWLGEENLIWPFIGLGRFYEGQGFYDQAAPYLEQCLIVSEKRLGENHPDVATTLNNLAGLYYNQGRYTEAERLFIRALSIYEQQVGENHPDVANSLNSLAVLYVNQGRYTEAEPLYIRALSIYEQQLGENHPDVATSLNNLAALYYNQGRYTEAEPLYIRALSICEQQLGENHPDVANSLNNLALLYDNQGRYTEAEPLYIRARSIREQQLGENHPDVANSLNNLAVLYEKQGRYTEAEPLYIRALSIYEQQLGENHPLVATSLNNLALLYDNQGRYTEAEPLYIRALSIREQQLGENHPSVATSLNNLALLYYNHGRYTEAEPLYIRALSIYEQQLG
ncbi:MAG: tetratricopeptide repeat protein, partial [Dolichospermum sp.]